MLPEEIASLMRRIAGHDQRFKRIAYPDSQKNGSDVDTEAAYAQEVMDAWYTQLQTIPLDAALDIVERHYTGGDTAITPAAIRREYSDVKATIAAEASKAESRGTGGSDDARTWARAYFLTNRGKSRYEHTEPTDGDIDVLTEIEYTARSVQCPYCRAQPGRSCMRPHSRNGKELRDMHPSRYEAAGLEPPLPFGGGDDR